MATTKTKSKQYETKRALSDYYLYVPLGAGQLLVEKTKSLTGRVFTLAKDPRRNVTRTYQDLAHRGQKVAKSIRTSKATRRAMSQTKTARSRVRAAATSVRKAAGNTAEATKVAAKKVG